MLYIYNSLTRRKERFIPLKVGEIGLYACGITVYDLCHLGHARSMICFDVMVRFLRSQQYTVKYVRNITDIDDKIIARANEQGVAIDKLTDNYIQAMHADCDALNIISPDLQPRATHYIDSIIRLIQRLIENKSAYVGDNGDVYYHVSSFPAYGKLSHKDLDGLEAGARIDVVEAKRSPMDFVLWKKAKPTETHWSSPWGEGRPGWHIECSAMAMDALGEQFDIHGGGLDLQFPHHENEIAQSEGATGKPFANYWLHVGMLQVNNEKMSKSTGNFLTIRDVLAKHHPEVIRYFLLSSHYRSPLNYSDVNLENATKALNRLYQSLRGIEYLDVIDNHSSFHAQFNDAMNDDFNTPVALSVLFELSRELNKTKSPQLAMSLKQLANTLGLLQESPESFLQAGQQDVALIEALIQDRQVARHQKDWTKADALRMQLFELGIEIEDSVDGTVWRVISHK